MNLPTVAKLSPAGKNILVRADLDIPVSGEQIINTRLRPLLPTLNLLLKKKASKILLLGHRGRPSGTFQSNLSLESLVGYFASQLKQEVSFIPFTKDLALALSTFQSNSQRLYLFENLRFWTGEKAADSAFASILAQFGSSYLFDAFATSHRPHASVVALPKLMLKQKKQVALGPQFLSELEHLNRVLNQPARPSLILVNGVKKDKLDHLPGLIKHFNRILIGGRLPEFLPESPDPKVSIGRLVPDKCDLTLNSLESFESEIAKAKTIVLSGPISCFEEPGHELGTKRVLSAIAQNTSAYRVAGGGDTAAAIERFGHSRDFDWISVGGGAMLHYLSQGSLPILEVFN